MCMDLTEIPRFPMSIGMGPIWWFVPRIFDVPDDLLPDRGQAFRAQRGHLEEPEQVLLLERRKVEAEAGHVAEVRLAPLQHGDIHPWLRSFPCALIQELRGEDRLARPRTACEGDQAPDREAPFEHVVEP